MVLMQMTKFLTKFLDPPSFPNLELPSFNLVTFGVRNLASKVDPERTSKVDPELTFLGVCPAPPSYATF